ncbi:MFS transporter [Pseudohoeflea coraliihabitans]|uniref:MFS transporter n=1 Tax=Pseudohoeflea coraliihabitans TaxID=2860393 RepID=A0ABS6WP57_9HYPH|nr:MFS transporter [Pseudohoeflea sp. DP4N28-3]MBW3097690.1 MFS transporter [Pseudohoeflea sp. DP4N28-3]
MMWPRTGLLVPSRLMAPMTFGLGVTMTIGYGTLYYPFAILGPEIARHFGWADSFVFGVFSIALLSSALAAPLAGRLLDRVGARPVLMLGSALVAACLVWLSQISGRASFIAAILLAECLSVMVLYDACFAALTAMHGLKARRHITHVTLIAGFASTIFWPLIHAMLTVMDWRGVFLVLAAINACIALPIHWLLPRSGRQMVAGLRAPPPSPKLQVAQPANPPQPGLLPPNRRLLPYVLMALSFACGGFLMSAVHTSFFLLLGAIGRDAALAALAGAIIGPMQVGARLLELLSGGRVAASLVGLISNGAMALGIGLLVLAWGNFATLPVIVFAAAFGIGQGLTFVARAILPARLFGTHGYGRVTGNLAAVRLAFTAAGPFFTTICLETFGVGAAFTLLGTVAAAGLVTALALVSVELRLRPEAKNISAEEDQ